MADGLAAEIVAVLRGAGARFALLHASRAAGSARADSDVDVAAWWPSHPPAAFEVLVSPGIDLVVLNGAPLELAGRIALHGRVLFDDESTRENSLDRYHAQDLRRRRAAAAAQPPRVR